MPTSEAKSTSAGDIRDFLVSHGGAFFDLQRRLKLLHDRNLFVGRRAAIFVFLAWGVPFLLSLISLHAFGPYEQRPFLLDFAVWARFFVAVGLFILMERQVEQGLLDRLHQFVRAPILAPESITSAAAATAEALRRRDSTAAEILCLVLAVVASIFSLINVGQSAETSTWVVEALPDGRSLTLAGWWCLFVSSPIFWFLFLRCLWRHFVWSMLLRKLAKLELRLVATHPDGKGGLAFVGQYPNAYATFIFAVSCVVAAAIAHELLSGRLSTTVYGSILSIWLVIVLALFAFPLSAFTPPLSRLKRETQALAGAQATQFHRLSEHKVLGRNVAAPEAGEAVDADITDPSPLFDKAGKMSVYLVSRAALVPVCAAAILPLAAAGITKMPYKEVFALAKKLLLL